MRKVSYRRHRFPPEIIPHGVWLYFRFPLNLRDVEDLLAERGIDVSYETVRRWSVKFGLAYADKLRRSHPRPDTRWHLDEVFVSISGRQMYLWRALDSEGEMLDIQVQSRRNRKSALKLMRKWRRTLTYQSAEGSEGCNASSPLHQSRDFFQPMPPSTTPSTFSVISRKTLRQFRGEAMGTWQTVTAAA